MAKSKKGKAVIAGVAAVSAASILTVRGIFHKVFARQEKEDDAISLRYKDMSGMVRKKITIVSGSTHLTGYMEKHLPKVSLLCAMELQAAEKIT